MAFFEVAALLTRNPLFGLRFGAGPWAPRSGIPGYLLMNAPCFRSAIQDLACTLPTLVGGVRVELVDDREPPVILWSIVANTGPATQFTSHANAYFVQMLQAHRGRSWRPLSELGLSFSGLRDDERFGLAHSLLESGSRSIGEIAASLGYT